MKKLLVVLLILVLIFVVVGLALPTEYVVAAEIDIDAPPQEIHEYVGDLERWPEWDPWREIDPSIQTTYGDKTAGVGAHQSWTGSDGGGELTLTAADPQEGIAYDMVLIRGDIRAPAHSTMRYEPLDGQTKVVWTIEGDTADWSPPIVRGYINLLLKGAIEESFEQGLATLEAKVEEDEEAAPEEVEPSQG